MRRNIGWLVGVGLLVSLALAFGASRYASSEPDGLERVAADRGFDRDVRDHALTDGPFADYSTSGVEDEDLSTGVAGVAGVIVTVAAVMALVGVVTLVRRRSSAVLGTSPPADGVASAAP